MAKKKIDPLNKKAYGAVSAALTVADIPAAVSFYQKAFGFAKRGIMKGPDGKPMNDNGKMVEIWKKQADGNWKCIVDTWSSDLPATPPPSK